MISILLAVGSFLACLLAGSRSLKLGLCAIIGVGYIYGIARANYPDTWTYLMFDLGAIGSLHRAALEADDAGSARRVARPPDLAGDPDWVARAAVHCLPHATIRLCRPSASGPTCSCCHSCCFGARLTNDDLKDLALFLAVLNLAAVALGTVEFFIGIEPFFPMNEVTEIIYKQPGPRRPHGLSHPLVVLERSRLRGRDGDDAAGARRRLEADARTANWESPLLASAVVASFLGVFMAAARTHMITVALDRARRDVHRRLVGAAVDAVGRCRRRSWAMSSPAMPGSSDSRRCRTARWCPNASAKA